VTISVTTILTVIAFSLAIEITLVHRAGRVDRDKLSKTIRHFSRIVLPLLFVITNLLMIAIYFG
jgi:hypothetical protein